MRFILKIAAAVLPGLLLATAIPEGYVLIPANSEFEFAQAKNLRPERQTEGMPGDRERPARNMGNGRRGMSQNNRQQRRPEMTAGRRGADGGRSDSSQRQPPNMGQRGNMMRKGEAEPLKSDYYLSKYPVTNTEYQKFIDATGRQAPAYWTDGKFPEGRDNHPVVMVSYEDVTAYCEWLASANSGWTFRLPTEAEWENAAAGSQKFLYPWGDESNITVDDGKVAAPLNFNAIVADEYLQGEPERFVEFCNSESKRKGKRVQIKELLSINDNGMVKGWSDPRTHSGFEDTDLFQEISAGGGCTQPVNAYSENVTPYGCCDMVGNAWEWTSSKAATQATNTGDAQECYVVRGGSWRSGVNLCNTKYRGEARNPAQGYYDVGFRIVAEQASAPAGTE